ncbi:hypothetical protein F5984_13460 [Rudanella paleaurantiibacter]|uniref:Uncharacterized protein n=1 Tax=Rudanella paleaurantiibacter TaxID=2614655 RepID=A0A7J5TYN0_9BACT|nr:hypothetical protein [Rudanella paleaurantiibacter]KAB7730181.1 hypothetical protein F5984_13460 [Rudanella paleaurantiibacter]
MNKTTQTGWMRKKGVLAQLWALLMLALPAWAHVGSAGVIVQKQVGKYSLLVQVLPPDVVPGTAKVTVFVEQGRVARIEGRPVYFNAGDEGAPTHDELTRTEANRFEGAVWLMESGSTSIQLAINGPDGPAEVVVPVVAISTATRDMPAGTGAGLALMGLVLVGMMITIIGASNADGVGVSDPKALRRKRLVGMGIGGVVLVLLLTGGRFWWDSWADEYRAYQLYKPVSLISSARPESGGVVLTIRPDTTGFAHNRQRRRDFNLLIPDHGKLMHAFLVRADSGMDAFAHLHPERTDSLQFTARLPQLPGGRYLLFADVVYRSGYTETLTDTLDLPMIKQSAAQAALGRVTDPDDSFLITEPMGVKQDAVGKLHLDEDMVACGKPGASTKLADGSTMVWTDKPGKTLDAGKLYMLKFAVADPTGKAATLEPYLGMSGHAAILRSDGTVYIHLHPVGTYSMAAEETLSKRIADTSRAVQKPNSARFRDSIDTYLAQLKEMPESRRNALLKAEMGPMNHAMSTNNMVEFPYAFPRAGHYRVWVQVKRNGQVLTGAFDTQVRE